MRFIPTRVHGAMDYLMGLVLIAVPWVLGFAEGGAETWIPVGLGIGAIVYSMLTDYELGAVPMIGMKAHLGLDIAAGVLLLASPWLFGFSDRIFIPHVVLGAVEVAAALMTQTTPSRIRHTTHQHAPVAR